MNMMNDIIVSIREAFEQSWEVLSRAYDAIMKVIGYLEK